MRKTKPETGRVSVRNLTRRRIPGVRSIKRTIRKVLELEGCGSPGLGVIYVNAGRMVRLNREYRGRDYPTDVLAFSMREGCGIKGGGGYLGDIAISLDAASRQAKHFNSTRDAELKLYLIHGVLHLLGYDDESAGSFEKMRKRQEYLMKKV